ncbi:PAS domain-containing protein [Palleronia rufa]|uniref:PAS domain-containing protein n=1 Tax=Palleronia rufa TaxID=1530186 RepID=UPI00055E6536|nr:PAS domain-containing protein [Palleronia rufa]
MSETPDDRNAENTLQSDSRADRFRERHAGQTFSGPSGVLFGQAMAQTRMAICLADPAEPNMPIVFVNDAFADLTGYGRDEVTGRNCRFLQGPDTDPRTVAKIRSALDSKDVVAVEILNYRKDGSRFWNALHLGPIYDDTGRLVYYFGSQWDVSDVRAARADEQHARMMARELSHRIKNLFAVIGGVVTVTGRTHGIEREAIEINERIRALARAFETTLDDASQGSVDLRPAVAAVLGPYDPAQDRIRLTGAPVRVDPSLATTVGLALNELAADAAKRGALVSADGGVTLGWTVSAAGGLLVHWSESVGAGIEPPGDAGTGFGIIEALVGAIGGSVLQDRRAEGPCVKIAIPDAVARK